MMNHAVRWVVPALLVASLAQAQTPGGHGSEEFGLSQRELVQATERVETLIARCMRGEGFQYVAADYNTVRAGMSADKRVPGLSEEQFIEQHGFGVATMYTGEAPQLAKGYSPARAGLGERNVQYFQGLSPTERIAYNHALFGNDSEATFAVALETENFSRSGGCTLKAVEQVFKPDQLKADYYNPTDGAIRNDPRMKAALRKYAAAMKRAGFDYTHPDEVEPDIRARLAALTSGGSIPVDRMTSAQRANLKRLAEYERRVAIVSFRLQEELLVPVEETIQREMFARKVQ